MINTRSTRDCDRAHLEDSVIAVGIPKVSFHRKVLSEAMNLERFDVCGIADAFESRTGGEGNGSGACEDLRCIVEEHLVHNVGSKRSPVDHRTPFHDYTGDLKFTEKLGHAAHVRASVG